MAKELGQLYVGIDCNNCGKHGEGLPAGSGKIRCGKCGQFGSELSGYCSEHDIDYGRMSGYDHCPICREERRIDEMEQEMHARRADPNMHPSIDARRF